MKGRVGSVAVAVGSLLLAAAAPPPATRTVIADAPADAAPAVARYVSVPRGVVVLRGVRLIDGTGTPALTDRTIVLRGRMIDAVGGPDTPIPPGATVLALPGRTVLPGLVGMHDHLFHISLPNVDAGGSSEPPRLVPQMSFSAPRLYLAMGVTTIRTAGSVEPYADLNLKRLIDAGKLRGPRMDVTAPYLEGRGSRFVQMHEVSSAREARDFVRYWAAQGATSIKLYTGLTRAEARAGIAEAHARGLRVTGHLCSLSYAEAIAIGIDNIEHGFFADTVDDPGKRPDTCPATAGAPTLDLRVADPTRADALIATLVARRVAITSTLPVFEAFVAGRPRPSTAALAMLSPSTRSTLMATIVRRDTAERETAAADLARYRGAAALERRFVSAGGLLVSGPDPTGNGAVIPGFGDLHAINLLAQAGFGFEQAVRIATLNGAAYLGLSDRIGTVEPGKIADLIVIAGDPAAHPEQIEQVDTVFKDGTGYDSARLRASVAGRYGQY